MLVACARCGGIHQRGKCPKGALPFGGYTKNRGRGSKGRNDIQKFRSTAAWQRKRIEILQRDYFICRWCFLHGKLTRHNLEVHHIIPIKENDSLKLKDSNLITVCSSCHDEIENEKDLVPTLMQLASNPPAIGINKSCL